jgi:hypothetical protein
VVFDGVQRARSIIAVSELESNTTEPTCLSRNLPQGFVAIKYNRFAVAT